ncbi:MAG TPA: SRPBCC family protein [Jatrophihabitans sp.]|jgi:hypothetical protein
MAFFSFRSQWQLPVEPQAAYDALADIDRYPQWWPQVRSTRRLDEHSGELVIRSALPFSLRVVATRAVQDPQALTLAATLSGDLTGHSSWQVNATPSGCTAVFIEEVTADRLFGASSFLGRRALEWNHAAMMRSGERGLRRHLSAAGLDSNI